jgi:hypothetical protein
MSAADLSFFETIKEWFNKTFDFANSVNCFELYRIGIQQPAFVKNRPVIQIAVIVLWTLFSFLPELLGGHYGLYIFQMVCLVYFILFLLVSFAKNGQNECNVYVFQTIAFIVLTNYIYAALRGVLRPKIRT